MENYSGPEFGEDIALQITIPEKVIQNKSKVNDKPPSKDVEKASASAIWKMLCCGR
jgi:hypothetical protein|tara:strand:- start:14348 stop:14515 length:168 start_codon:yes stop_codon:yes gene_type:complete